jgi:hypothetical protein
MIGGSVVELRPDQVGGPDRRLITHVSRISS